MSALDQAEARIIDALWTKGRATMGDILDMTGIKHTTCHKAITRLKVDGAIAVVDKIPTRTNPKIVYALSPHYFK